MCAYRTSHRLNEVCLQALQAKAVLDDIMVVPGTLGKGADLPNPIWSHLGICTDANFECLVAEPMPRRKSDAIWAWKSLNELIATLPIRLASRLKFLHSRCKVADVNDVVIDLSLFVPAARADRVKDTFRHDPVNSNPSCYKQPTRCCQSPECFNLSMAGATVFLRNWLEYRMWNLGEWGESPRACHPARLPHLHRWQSCRILR
jgi:hypothetical protein